MKQEDITEFLLVTATAGLGIIAAGTNDAAQMGALTSGVLWAWQKENAGHFLSVLNQKCQRLNREKLDYSALESDEFKALLIEAVDTASKTASELKRKALANALINSVVIPTSKLPGKQALLRVLSGMSDEEMLALTALHNYESGGYEKITLERLAQKTGWSEEENTVAFEGLNQLGLARPMGVMGNDMFGGLWKITALGKRLVRWQLKTS